MTGWKRGMPPGKYYEGMFDDFEVSFTIGGAKWHRRRTPEEKAAHLATMQHIRKLNESVLASLTSGEQESAGKDSQKKA